MTRYLSRVLPAAMLVAASLSAPVCAQSAPGPAAPAVPNAPPRRAQMLMGAFAPQLAEITDAVLYKDVWERPGLSKRDRSLVTMAALIVMNRPDQFRSHVALAKTNGVTQEEIAEMITHLAFYAGWPNAVSAGAVAKDVLQVKR